MNNTGRFKRSVEEYLLAARREIARRAVRSHVLDPDYFGEGAWNMLLDLYVSTFEHRGAVPTTSLVLASQAPATTGMRYLATLEAAGEVERMPSPSDGRVNLVVMTCEGRSRIETTLGAMIAAEAKVDSIHIKQRLPETEMAI